MTYNAMSMRTKHWDIYFIEKVQRSHVIRFEVRKINEIPICGLTCASSTSDTVIIAACKH